MILFLPLVIVVAALLSLPLDILLKKRIIKQAKQKIIDNPNVTIIWVTGSYGKTSVKEYIKNLLQDSLEVIAPEWTHNTLLWMSKFIIKELKQTTQVMIVEMGAYVPGDIRMLCDIAHPNMAVITGITKQHLERFKTLDNIISTKFEITEWLWDVWILFVDWENEAIKKWLELYTKDEKYWIIKIWKLDVNYLPDFKWISFRYDNINYTTKLLWAHNAKNLALAIAVAQKLWVSSKEIQERVKRIWFVQHRLELLHNERTGVYVIDDSFNWNIEWVKSTIQLLKNTPFTWKRIYLTPWLVELWEDSKEIHFKLGTLLSSAVDLVVLIQNENTLKIKEWLISQWFDENKVIMLNNTQEAHNQIWQFAKKWDLIVFQNDLTDNYL